MDHDDSEFCGSLQAEWSVDEVVYARGEVTVRISRSASLPYPDPLGRPGRLVMSEPTVFREVQSADIRFKSVEWCQVVDEFSFATAKVEMADDAEQFSGQYFRCFSRSRLLTALTAARTDQAAARLKHYQLVTQSEVIDVVSIEAPEVVIRGNIAE